MIILEITIMVRKYVSGLQFINTFQMAEPC